MIPETFTMKPTEPLIRPRAILFDMDGTLTEPYLDFDAMKAEMGIPNQPILETLAKMNNADRAKAEAILHRHEEQAAVESTLNPGCVELLTWLKTVGIETALITRNTRRSVETVFDRHELHFDICITREDGKFKPDPAPLLLACERLKMTVNDAWMVGDSYHDIDAGTGRASENGLVESRQNPEFCRETVENSSRFGGVNEVASRVSELRMVMKINGWKLVVAAAICTVSSFSFAEAPPPLINPVNSTITQDSPIDDVLDALQARGKDLKEFVADVKLIDTDTTMSTSNHSNRKNLVTD